MDVIEISSDSESDCVISPQPPLKKQRKTYRERMNEARGKTRADEVSLLQKTKKTAVEEAREDSIADKERQHGEEKHEQGQRRQPARGGSEDAVMVVSVPAVEASEQRQETREVRDEALVDSPHLPFPMKVPALVAAPIEAVALPAAPSCAAPSSTVPSSTVPSSAAPSSAAPSSAAPSSAAPSSAASSPVASPRFRADERAQPLHVLPIAAERSSLPDTAAASAKNPAPTRSDRGARLRASAVTDSSDFPTQQKSPKQVSLDQSRCLSQQQTRRENPAPAPPTPLQAVMAHWGRVRQRPGQLFRRQADDDTTR